MLNVILIFIAIIITASLPTWWETQRHKKTMRDIYKDSVEFWYRHAMENPTRDRVASLKEAIDNYMKWV